MTDPNDPHPPDLSKGQPPPGNYPPPQGSYPPPQGGFPPPQGGYPPPQGGYPPPQGGYPPPGPYPNPGYPQPVVDPAGRVFDQESGIYLPAGTQLASNGRRIGAYFLAIPLSIVTLGIGYAIWGLVLWNKGTTPALRVLGMKCYHPDRGTVPTFGGMALREIVGRIADGILSLITVLVSFILMLTSRRRQSLHDLVGSTVVLYDPERRLG